MAKNTAYTIGDSDFTRGWGGYVVTNAGTSPTGDEFCEKEITIAPSQILSLQSHDYRREHWKVLKGSITVILNGQSIALNAGDELDIEQGAIHAIANLGAEAAIIHETQQGLCREDDIHRYKDFHGRAEEPATTPLIKTSIELYNNLVAKIKSAQP